MVSLPPWIETFTGKQFYFLDPAEDQIDIKDIAHALAYTCRYTGHCKRFYSVAEHSILVSYLANDPLAGLLHDSSEAYITDIASPIKEHLDNYKQLEDRIMSSIAKKYGFQYPLDIDVKDCDATQLKTEAKYLLHSKGELWAHFFPTKRQHGIKPNCLSPEQAEKAFLERYEEVRNVAADSFEPRGTFDTSRNLFPGVGRYNGVVHVQVDEGRSKQIQGKGSIGNGTASQGSCCVGSEDHGGCSRRTTKAFDMGAIREHSVRGGSKT